MWRWRPRPSAARLAKGVAGFTATTLEDRWILSRFNGVADYVNEALEDLPLPRSRQPHL